MTTIPSQGPCNLSAESPVQRVVLLRQGRAHSPCVWLLLVLIELPFNEGEAVIGFQHERK